MVHLETLKKQETICNSYLADFLNTYDKGYGVIDSSKGNSIEHYEDYKSILEEYSFLDREYILGTPPKIINIESLRKDYIPFPFLPNTGYFIQDTEGNLAYVNFDVENSLKNKELIRKDTQNISLDSILINLVALFQGVKKD